MGQKQFYRTSHKLEHHFLNIKQTLLLVFKLEHPIFGFERLNIELEPNRAFTRFTKKLLIELTKTCSSIGNSTRTPHFWLRMIVH